MSPALRTAAALSLGAMLLAAAAPSRIARASLRALERTTDSSFEELMKEDPVRVLGATRAVYLDGYGVVFSTEVELVPSAAPNPFRPQTTKEDIVRLREKKKIRISYVKENMPAMLVRFATELTEVPANENVALAVSILYFSWEDSEGLPRQILMSAPRKELILAEPQARSAAIRTQEFY